MKRSNFQSGAYESGFSLIEILVGLVIGMLSILIMMQVFELAEQRKRTTTASGDSQSSAMIALDALQRDFTQAGYGFASMKILGCNITLPSAGVVALAPVVINPAALPAGDANTDVVLFGYGNGNGQPEGQAILSQSGTVYTMASTGTHTVGDKVFASPDPCTGVGMSLASITAKTVSSLTVSAATTGTMFFNLGNAPQFRAYAVRNGNLTVCDYVATDCTDLANWVDYADNVVSLRVQYGKDTAAAGSMDGAVDAYDQVTPTTACGWVRTSALRLVLVTRSAQYEKEVVTSASPTWAGSGTVNIDVSQKADGTPNPDWNHYRYRALETTIPLRNVSWMGAQSGC